jgi:hypothetical protein
MAAGIAAVALFGFMLFLFFRNPVINYSDSEHGAVRAECGSIAAVGWPGDGDYLLDENGGGSYPDSIDGDLNRISDLTRADIHRDCDQERETQLGFLALLAVPTSVLASAAITAALRRSPAGSAAEGGRG